MASITTHRSVAPVAAYTRLAWLGLYIHNRIELPHLTLWSPENSLPTLVFGVLFVAWWLLPYARTTVLLYMLWALLHLVGGGIISVLPLPFLPFAPEQTVQHYATHVVYGVTQVPLIGMMYSYIRQDGER